MKCVLCCDNENYEDDSYGYNVNINNDSNDNVDAVRSLVHPPVVGSRVHLPVDRGCFGCGGGGCCGSFGVAVWHRLMYCLGFTPCLCLFVYVCLAVFVTLTWYACHNSPWW